MQTTMTVSCPLDIVSIKTILALGNLVKTKFESPKRRDEFVVIFWKNIRYFNLSKKDKIICLKYLKIVTGLKPSRLFKIFSLVKNGQRVAKKYIRKNIHRKYTTRDIKLLEKTDEVHLRLNPAATKVILQSEFQIYGKREYENISKISSSHIQNLRRHEVYQFKWIKHTHARVVPIGNTKKPEPNGKPGYIRVDTVHQQEIYYLHLVDEVTQWEGVVALAAITNEQMEQALTLIFQMVPFVIHNFHSDRGSENINYRIARMLNKLKITQSKCRSGQHNDNALVEGKNNSIIRKNFGYGFMPKQGLRQLNYYLLHYFVPYLNYHRPCLFATIITLANGKTYRKYITRPQTPFEKLWELSGHSHRKFFKKTSRPTELFAYSREFSHNEFATALRNKEREVFDLISGILKLRKEKR
jgi:hypothetical protein